MTSHVVRIVGSSVALLVIWQLLGMSGLLGPAFPALSDVAAVLVDPTRTDLFLGAISATLLAAAFGLVIGGGSGIVLAGLRRSVHAVEPGLDRFAAMIHALPQIAIAPVLIVLLGREQAPFAVSALAAFFPAYAAATKAFRASRAVHHDLFSVWGSSRLNRLFGLDLPAALPGLADALRLAAPGSVIGAVLGEWFGAPRGVGLIILSSSQAYDIPLLWAAAALSTLLALAQYLVFTGVQTLAARRFG